MSTVNLNGVTVFVQAIETVADGVSHEFDRLWRSASNEHFYSAMRVNSLADLDALGEKFDELEFPKEADYPAVIVKLTSGREFRIVGKTRKEVEEEIHWAKRRDR